MADRNGGWNTGKNDFVYVGRITKRNSENGFNSATNSDIMYDMNRKKR